MVEGAIYKIDPLVGEDDSDYVDKWDHDTSQEDHSKILPPQEKLLKQSFICQHFLEKKWGEIDMLKYWQSWTKTI